MSNSSAPKSASLNLSNHKAIDTYYAALSTYQSQGVTHEQATRLAFSTLLDTISKTVGWTLVLEQTLSNRKRPDGTLQDSFKIPRGYWEAKDTQDDLDAEIRKKIERKYPLTNTIFEDTRRAVLYQNSRPVFEADLAQRSQLVALLTRFFSYTGEQIEEFHAAVGEFKQRIPELAKGLMERIEEERGRNQKFVAAFEEFQRVCRASIDPNISVEEIEEMLVQHLLTERLFRTVFDDPDFTDRNVIASEIEKVIKALTSRSFNRSAFLKRKLPRISFVAREVFRVFVDTGARLADLHLNYEQAKEYPLKWSENKDVPFSWRVAKMQLSKDKAQVKVNESLTLAGLPAECFEYRLGNRSALEWVIDQYQISTDKRSGITSDPNRADDEEYIARLVGRVVTVSVETVKLVKALPAVVEAASG